MQVRKNESTNKNKTRFCLDNNEAKCHCFLFLFYILLLANHVYHNCHIFLLVNCHCHKKGKKKKTPPLPCSRRSHPTNQKCFSHFQKPFLYQSIFIFTSLMPQAIILLSTLPYLYTQFWDSHSLLGSFLFFSFLILPYLGHPFFGFLSKKETCDKSLLQGFCFYTPRVSVDCLKSVGHSLMKEKLDSSSLKRSLWVDQTW